LASGSGLKLAQLDPELGESGQRKKPTAEQPHAKISARIANAPPLAGSWHSASQQVLRRKYGRGAVTSRSVFFAENPGRFVDSHGPQLFPDSVRLALPRPPNLESQYQRKKIFCQEKKSKMLLIFSHHVYL